MTELVVEPSVEAVLNGYVESKPQALLITGLEGVGLATIAKWLADKWGETVDVVTPMAKTKTAVPTVSVERIRSLYDTTRTKSTKELVAIIDDADFMSEAAQNALLKLLEEPGGSLHFIVTSHAPEALLPTILSRMQRLHIAPVDTIHSSRFIKQLGIRDEATLRQLLYVADGRPALLHRLARNPAALNDAARRVRLARDYIAGNSYERLVIAQNLGNNRSEALQLVSAIIHMLRTSLEAQPDDSTIQRIERLLDVQESLLRNGNVRLQIATTVV